MQGDVIDARLGEAPDEVGESFVVLVRTEPYLSREALAPGGAGRPDELEGLLGLAHPRRPAASLRDMGSRAAEVDVRAENRPIAQMGEGFRQALGLRGVELIDYLLRRRAASR